MYKDGIDPRDHDSLASKYKQAIKADMFRSQLDICFFKAELLLA